MTIECGESSSAFSEKPSCRNRIQERPLRSWKAPQLGLALVVIDQQVLERFNCLAGEIGASGGEDARLKIVRRRRLLGCAQPGTHGYDRCGNKESRNKTTKVIAHNSVTLSAREFFLRFVLR